MRGLISFALAITVSASVVYAQGTEIRGPKGTDVSEQQQAYGPIQDIDTLWRIAARVRPNSSVTMYQVMVALYEQNPSAFLDNNLNHLVDGAYLQVPTLAQIRSVDPEQARQKSLRDDKAWEQIKKTLTPPQVKQSQQTQAAPAATNTAPSQSREQIEQQLADLKRQQQQEIEQLQQKFKASMGDLEAILAENQRLKSRLKAINDQVSDLQAQLKEKDAQIQQQVEGLLQERATLAAQLKEQKQQADSAIPQWAWLAALMTVPALLILLLVLLFLKKRQPEQSPESQEQEEDFLPQSAAPQGEPVVSTTDVEDIDLSADDTLEDEPLDEQFEDEPLEDIFDDNSIQLDDDDSDQNDLLAQDEMDQLLGEDDALPEPSDDFLTQNFDQQSDDIAVDLPEDDALPEFEDDMAPSSANSDALDESDEAMVALSEQLASENPDAEDNEQLETDVFDIDDIDDADAQEDEIDLDVDAILAEQQNEDAQESQQSDDETTLVADFDLDDDSDDLLAQNAQSSDAEDELDVDELLSEEQPQAVDEEDELDIDELLDEQQSEDEQTSVLEADLDLDSADEVSEEQPQADDEEDELDIDELLEEQQSEDEQTSVLEADLDLDSADEVSEEQPQADDEEDELDIDELLDEQQSDDEQASALEADLDLDSDDEVSEAHSQAGDDEDELDIDDLLAEHEPQTSDETDAFETPSEDDIAAQEDHEQTQQSEHKAPLDFDSEQLPQEPHAHSAGAEPEVDADELMDDLDSAADLAINDDELSADLEPEQTLDGEAEQPSEPEPEDISEEKPALEHDLDFHSLLSEPDESELDLDSEIEQVADLGDDPLEDMSDVEEVDISTPSPEQSDAYEPSLDDLNEQDFDQMLDELGDLAIEPEDLDSDTVTPISEQHAALDDQPEVEVTTSEPQAAGNHGDYLDIDDLLAQSDEQTSDDEPYIDANIDVGLDEFEDLLEDTQKTDVDQEDGGFGAKLDLARAYIEIDDTDSAVEALEDIIENGPSNLQEEASALKKRLEQG